MNWLHDFWTFNKESFALAVLISFPAGILFELGVVTFRAGWKRLCAYFGR